MCSRRSLGCFFWFKLHLICNKKGESLNFMMPSGDIDGCKSLENNAFIILSMAESLAISDTSGRRTFREIVYRWNAVYNQIEEKIKEH